MSPSAKEMNTALAKRLKAIFRLGKMRKYSASRKNTALKKPRDEKALEAEHLSVDAPPQGVLGRDSLYAQRGSNYIRKHNGRGVYTDVNHDYFEKIADVVKDASFPGGAPWNFDPGATAPNGGSAGQQFPYAWEAHHILPGSAFYYVLDGKPAFTHQQYRLILSSPYNINHGHNIIMLPAESWAAPIHRLLQHATDHPNYTVAVIRKMKVVSKRLQKTVDTAADHKALSAEIFQQLKDLEEDFWSKLKTLGRAVVAAVVANESFEHPYVRFAAKSGTRYDFGALF